MVIHVDHDKTYIFAMDNMDKVHVKVSEGTDLRLPGKHIKIGELIVYGSSRIYVEHENMIKSCEVHKGIVEFVYGNPDKVILREGQVKLGEWRQAFVWLQHKDGPTAEDKDWMKDKVRTAITETKAALYDGQQEVENPATPADRKERILKHIPDVKARLVWLEQRLDEIFKS